LKPKYTFFEVEMELCFQLTINPMRD